jgi:16S rRNA (guanine527-N7)-methyltransferase
MPGATTIEGLAATHGLNAGQAAALHAYADLVTGWRRGNITGLRDREQVVERLLGDSLALLEGPWLRERVGGAWIDLGAGAGVPGVPLAVALPEADVTLLDSSAKKCAFLERAAAAAGLGARAHVVCARSERYAAPGSPGREAFSVVLTRAVAALPVLCELASPLLASGGVLLASTSARAAEAEADAARAAAVQCALVPRPLVPLRQSPLPGSVCGVFEKDGPTPERLPRREGVAQRRPRAAR